MPSTSSSHSGLSRRDLLKAAASVPIVTALGTNAFASQPTRGGHLRLGLAGGTTTDTLNPLTWSNTVIQVVGSTYANTLVEIAPDNSIRGLLAESWDVSDGGKRWVFKLRKGVTFHSGKSLNADDVIASLRLHIGPESASPMKPTIANIESIKADGADTVEIVLKNGNLDFATLLTGVWLTILPSRDGKIDIAGRDGTGPYKIEEFEPGVRITFSRNKNYWNAGAGSYLDSAEIIVVNDVAARMNALRAGEVDIINSVDAKTVSLLKRIPQIVVETLETGRHYAFQMWADTTPFNDVNVRLALKHAINRQEFIDKVLHGYGSLGNDHPISKLHNFHDASIPQREYDADKALFHLKKAGLSSLDLNLSVAEVGFAGSSMAGQLYAESARSTGLNINVIQEPDDNYFNNVLMRKPFNVDYWSYRVSEDQIFSLAYSSDAPYNETHFQDARFDQLLAQARVETNDARRREIYSDMQRILHNEGGAVVPAFANFLWAMNNKVGHPEQVSSSSDMDGLHVIERWWLND